MSLAFWIMLIWPVTSVDGRLLTGDIAVGIAVAAFVALIMHNIIRVKFVRLVNPVSWFWAFVYLFVLSYYVIKGGVDVSYRVLHPRMPIRPGIVRVRSILETDTGRAALANCITLTLCGKVTFAPINPCFGRSRKVVSSASSVTFSAVYSPTMP